MPKEYILKHSPLDKNRILKLCKVAMEHATDDRVVAKDTFKFFKALVQDNPLDNVSKTLMIDSLKLMQSSNKNEAALIDLFIKVEESLPDGKENAFELLGD